MKFIRILIVFTVFMFLAFLGYLFGFLTEVMSVGIIIFLIYAIIELIRDGFKKVKSTSRYLRDRD
jgi:uncharacterized membrane protein